MVRKKISLRWRASRKYHRDDVGELLSDELVRVWQFLEDIETGKTVMDVPIGAPSIKKLRFSDGTCIYMVIGRPSTSDSDRDADLYVEDFWTESDSSNN